MNRLPMLFTLLAGLMLAATTRPLPAADEKADKAKEKEKEKNKDKEKDDKDAVEWVNLLSVTNAPGGNKHFDLAKSGKVKFTWETKPDGQVPNFRVTVAKHNARTDSFQIIATIATTHGASKDSATMNLVEGKYRLYIATKFMKYTLNVEGKGK